MKRLILIFVVASIFASCEQKESIVFQIDGVGNDTLIVEYFELNVEKEPVRDTLVAFNGKFFYNPEYERAGFINIFLKSYLDVEWHRSLSEALTIMLLWKPGEKFRVDGNLKDGVFDYTVSQSDFNREASLHRLANREHIINLANAQLQWDSLMFSHTATEITDEAELEINRQKLTALRNYIQDENTASTSVYVEYVKNNPDSELSAFYVCGRLADFATEYAGYLGKSARQGLFGEHISYIDKQIAEHRAQQEKQALIQPGLPAPDFTLKSLDGKDISLYSIQKEYLVLDFWGSWCGWCIKGFPKMKEYYNKYNNRLEILGIACKDTDREWKQAVKKNNIKWLHVTNGENDDLLQKYAIEGFPTKIILDKEKKIIQVFIGETEEFYKKLDELLLN
ncbi:MAG: TlpA family protein disulfide reductase [Dysgonamonadaceae bacterium]|jgi:thiol-disulfide isomerase/thioredoxin|nr:TlpA family protein disulfide reductase [Dysgonamonadaceae bacterium]